MDHSYIDRASEYLNIRNHTNISVEKCLLNLKESKSNYLIVKEKYQKLSKKLLRLFNKFKYQLKLYLKFATACLNLKYTK